MKVPVILNNRDLLTYPKQMVEVLKSFNNIGDIFIVDNGSTYEPLLEWYETKPCEIIKTSNNGHLSPWLIDLPKKITTDYYVVSDSDLDLSITPKDCLDYLKDKLISHPEYSRIGLSLQNWNVSPESPYYSHCKGWGEKYWDINTVNDGLLLNQEIDTTFGLYHIDNYHRGRSCSTYSPYSTNHIPWEFTQDLIDNMETENYEYFYYLKNASSSSSYKKFINFNHE